jgi:hypothetical protein
MVDPQHPAVAAAILANSPRVAEQNYNLGGQVEAALKFQRAIQEERAHSAALARRIFRR